MLRELYLIIILQADHVLCVFNVLIKQTMKHAQLLLIQTIYVSFDQCNDLCKLLVYG